SATRADVGAHATGRHDGARSATQAGMAETWDVETTEPALPWRPLAWGAALGGVAGAVARAVIAAPGSAAPLIAPAGPTSMVTTIRGGTAPDAGAIIGGLFGALYASW